MTRRLAVLSCLAAVAAGSGCADGFRGGELAGPPTLSLSGASGVVADLRRTVTEVDADGERVVSQLDTTVWAPFNDVGAAVPASTDAGIPGPVGWLSRSAFDAPGWSRYGTFVDSIGVLHELYVVADQEGPGTRVEYRKGGRLAMLHRAAWTTASGGWVLADEAVTFLPEEAVPIIRVDVTARQMNVARVAPAAEVFQRAGIALADLVRPRPLAAQFHFGACSNEWLGWAGSALLAELAWVRFARSRRYRDFSLALAATTAAGVTLSKLVDCMAAQPDQPNSNQ
jgi:hypothetical protein